MRIKTISIVLIFILFINITSCKKKITVCKPKQITIANMQGNWQQNYVGLLPTDLAFIAPPQFEFTFKNDSFRMSICQKSDLIADKNGCQYLNWYEYAKGKFSLLNEQLFLKGIYTDNEYLIKSSGCYNSGSYSDTFKGQFCNDTMILNWNKKNLDEIESRNCKMYQQ